MLLILYIILLIKLNSIFGWNCTENKHFLFLNDQYYEQCTITIEYISSTNFKQICTTHRLSIKTLPPLSFNTNYTMHTFKINSCQLLTINQIPFLLPTTVENLDLSYNLLSTFSLTFPLPSYIKYLRLDHNPNLIDINFGYIHAQQRLIGLSLRHNKHLRLSSLPPYLKQLDLTDCNLLFQSSILSSLRSLTKLTHLSLADNQLKQLPLIDKRIQFEYLNLSNNHLTYMDHSWLRKTLRTLDIRYNQIESIEFFYDLFNINQTIKQIQHDFTINDLSLQVYLYGNPLVCDCWLGSILNSTLIKINDIGLIKCNSQSLITLSEKDFLCSYSQHCASECSCCDFEACDCHSVCPSECLCLHDALWSYDSIQCQRRNLIDIHMHLPETITELNYEGNHIEELKSFAFMGKKSLVKLNLAKNNLKYLNNDTFCGAGNLNEINLSYNKNLKFKYSNLNEIISCLKYLNYIILSKEQMDEDDFSQDWIFETNDDLIRLIRTNESLLLKDSSSIPNLYTNPTSTISTSSISQPTNLFSIYHPESFISTSFIQHNQILIITIFFLLLFILLFILLLLLLAICRRKLRRHLKTELQRQRSQHYYYHHAVRHPSILKIPPNNTNQPIVPNESLYEQLPSLSSDSEQPFLYHEKKATNVPVLPPYPPTIRHYHCCHTMNSQDYQYGRINSTGTSNSASNLPPPVYPTVLVLGNQTVYPNQHEYSCELQQYLLSNQPDKNLMLTKNICQFCDSMKPIDNSLIYPIVNKFDK